MKDMCYERLRAEAGVNLSAHRAHVECSAERIVRSVFGGSLKVFYTK